MKGTGVGIVAAKLCVVAAAVLGFAASANAQTNLQNAAQALSDGEWREFTSSNWSRSIAEAQPGSNRSVIDFSQRMHWDSIDKRLWFWGSGHQEPAKIIRYDANSDTWTNINSMPSAISNNGHAYDEQGIDVQGRYLWKKQHSSDHFHRMNLDTGSWQTDVLISPGAGSGVAQGMEIFPNFMGTTALLDYSSLYDLRFYDIEASGNPEMQGARYTTGGAGNDIVAGFNHQFIVYDPANQIVVLGGGKEKNNQPANRIYKIANNNALTELDRIPESLRSDNRYIGVGAGAAVLTPGNNGMLYAFQPPDVYELNPNAAPGNQWRQLPDSPLNDDNVSPWFVTTLIPEYNVIVVNTWAGNQSKMFLFKPGECNNCPVVDTIAPKEPTQVLIAD